ncbi:MAG: ABC transporter substrate-binding protein [Alphaproteobacteria bacterium]|nr:ABC transporter substrate-binding protein [Alphaproteobacteria bacterium]
MTKRLLAAMAAVVSLSALSGAAWAQANEQFMPSLVYRTGAYAVNGIPFANGYADYLNMLNERDGGINGVKLVIEECETGYATDRGVECYERLKGKGPTGAALFNPLSTGITYALMDRAPVDKIPVITMGYGRTEAADGSVVPWAFPILGTYWSAADIAMNYVARQMGGTDKLKGKRIALVYHDSPYGKEPIPVLRKLAQDFGFRFDELPVTHPGVEQKATWLQIRQNRPDYVLLWGWGVMNSTSIKEAAAVNFPRDRMIGVWWSGAEPDVRPGGDQSKGYKALALHTTGQGSTTHQDILRNVYDKNKGTGKREEVGEVLYNRGMINAVLASEAIRTAMARYGNKPLTGEQVRWGIENLNITDARIQELGLVGMMRPVKLSCADHEGGSRARIHQWDGSKWVILTDWIESNQKMLRPMVEEAAKKYAQEKNITARDCARTS